MLRLAPIARLFTASCYVFLLSGSHAFAQTSPGGRKPPPPPPSPSVIVTAGDPGDPDLNDPVDCEVNASVQNLPDAEKESTVVAIWSWDFGFRLYTPYQNADGTPPITVPVSDGTNFTVGLNGDSSDPTGTFNVTNGYQSAGWYCVQVIATVTYHDNSTGKDLLTISGSDTVGDTDNPDAPASAGGPTPPSDTSTSGGSSPVLPAITHALAAPAPTPSASKVVPAGTTVSFSSNYLKLGLYSVNHTMGTITATVVPAFAAPNVDFHMTKPEATATPSFATDAKGNQTSPVTFTVKAVSPTPGPLMSGGQPSDANNSPNGDAQLVAKVTFTETVNGQSVTKTVQAAAANVLVLEPEAVVQPPHNTDGSLATFTGPVTGINVAVGQTSHPSNYHVPANFADLYTRVVSW